MSFCLDTYLQQSDNYEIHASKAGFKDCAMIIRFKKKTQEFCEMETVSENNI